MYVGCQQVTKRILVSTKQVEKKKKKKKYRHKNMSWHWAKNKLKRLDVKKKHLGLVENRLRPRMKGTLLVIGALY